MNRVRATGAAPLVLAASIPAGLTGFAYWPGLVSWDPASQYDQIVNGPITDWHPPIMQALWAGLRHLHPGPMPMLLVQLALYWGGLVLLAAAARRRGRPGLGWALLACGLLPLGLALTGAILKDSLMAGALLVATGLMARGTARARIAAAVPLLFAAALRFNGFTACLPIAVTLLPPAMRRTRARLLASTLATAAVLLAAMPLANRAIGAEPSGVALSLVIFDLGGITEHAGTSVFPPALRVADPVRVNHRCYGANKWDSYSDWVDPECPLGFTAWRAHVGTAGAETIWLRAIVAHPLAYAAHRLAHFAINTRTVALNDAVERPVPVGDAPNDFGFRITPNPVLRTIDALAVAIAHTPVGWPIVWIALALAAAIAGAGTADAALILPVALSGLGYGLGYLVFSVASELRYHLWTGLAALIATVLVAANGRAVGRRRLAIAYLPVALAIAVALATRA